MRTSSSLSILYINCLDLMRVAKSFRIAILDGKTQQFQLLIDAFLCFILHAFDSISTPEPATYMAIDDRSNILRPQTTSSFRSHARCVVVQAKTEDAGVKQNVGTYSSTPHSFLWRNAQKSGFALCRSAFHESTGVLVTLWQFRRVAFDPYT